jgi:hypothetical protein
MKLAKVNPNADVRQRFKRAVSNAFFTRLARFMSILSRQQSNADE